MFSPVVLSKNTGAFLTPSFLKASFPTKCRSHRKAAICLIPRSISMSRRVMQLCAERIFCIQAWRAKRNILSPVCRLYYHAKVHAPYIHAMLWAWSAHRPWQASSCPVFDFQFGSCSKIRAKWRSLPVSSEFFIEWISYLMHICFLLKISASKVRNNPIAANTLLHIIALQCLFVNIIHSKCPHLQHESYKKVVQNGIYDSLVTDVMRSHHGRYKIKRGVVSYTYSTLSHSATGLSPTFCASLLGIKQHLRIIVTNLSPQLQNM